METKFKIKNNFYQIFERKKILEDIKENLYSENYLDDSIDLVSQRAEDILEEDYIKVFENKEICYYLPLENYDDNFSALQRLALSSLTKDEMENELEINYL